MKVCFIYYIVKPWMDVGYILCLFFLHFIYVNNGYFRLKITFLKTNFVSPDFSDFVFFPQLCLPTVEFVDNGQ